MRKQRLVLYALLAGVVGTALSQPGHRMQRRLSAQEDGIGWLSNYQEAVRQARETGKPIFLEFRCEP